MTAARPYVAYAAFLRAVNLGATRKLPMATVRTVLAERLGYDPVTTHIASGNVLFAVRAAATPREGTDAAAARHAGAIAEVLEEVAGFAVPTVVVTPAVLATVLAEQPYAPQVAKHVNVGFVQGPIGAALRGRVEAVADRAVEGEGVTVGHRAIYLHLPHSVHASALAAAVGKAAPEATTRNLATVQKMAELLASVQGRSGDVS